MNLSDWVVAATAVAATILSLIALVRTIRLERRTLLEPYFKSKWSNFEKKLSEHLETTYIMFQRPEQKDSNGYITSIQAINVEFDDLMKKYSRELWKLFNNYSATAKRLSLLIAEYNQLRMATDRLQVFLMKVEIPDNMPFSKESNADGKQFNEYLKKLNKKYLGSFKEITKKTLIELAENPNYKDDLRSLEDSINDLFSQLKNHHKKLSSIMRIYSAKFSD